MTYTQIMVLATPAFLALMAVDWWVGRRRGRDSYRLHDAMSSIGLGMVSQLANFLTRVVGFGIYVVVYQEFAIWRLPADAAWVWVTGLLFYDLCFYWHHRAGHRVAFLWATHAVHHQSEDYNLSTALRQPATNWVAGWVFYLPMALAGYPPAVLVTVGLIDILYQYWIHTQQVGRLGWADRWLNTPSNHRVHHAVNDEYLDRNYGGILIIWDRLFGTYTAERDDVPCVYGTRLPLHSWNPLWANVQVFAATAQESARATRWRDKLLVWLKPPDWRPAEVALRYPKPPFDVSSVVPYDPSTARFARSAAVTLFLATLGGVAWALWNAHRIGDGWLAVATLLAILALSLVGWLGAGPAASRRFEAVKADDGSLA
jgi:sterol desaturase/sphingolipid hydroxylase (fatty acid hydroxylase superfamily)